MGWIDLIQGCCGWLMGILALYILLHYGSKCYQIKSDRKQLELRLKHEKEMLQLRATPKLLKDDDHE